MKEKLIFHLHNIKSFLYFANCSFIINSLASKNNKKSNAYQSKKLANYTLERKFDQVNIYDFFIQLR